MTAMLSVIIPCRDVVTHIRACAESAQLVADEVLIADSGSSDGTVEAAQQIPGVRVIQGPWLGYAQFKNWAIPQTQHEWVLILDSDERVTPELASEIREAIATASDDVYGFKLGFRSFFLGYELRHASYNSTALRLFRREHGRYLDRRVHEEILIPREHTRSLREQMLHYSILDYDQAIQKWSRYTRLGTEDRWRAGKRATYFSLSLRPLLRFLQLYLLRGGFLDGAAGLQACMLSALLVTFGKQTRLFEREHLAHNHLASSPREDAVESPSRSRAA